MRLLILLILALAVTVLLTLFPEVADQTLQIQAFGWEFETRQGVFVVALLVIIFALWLIGAIISALLAGPGQLWRTLRMGSKKRRELKLREALARWLDMRGDLDPRVLKRARGVIPGWAASMLRLVATPAHELPLPQDEKDPLLIALAARLATDPNARPQPDLATRKAHLEAWLHAHPQAPLALLRLADVAEEEGDWSRAIGLLEQLMKQGLRASHTIAPRLARAYAALAARTPEKKLEYLRKAGRLAPDDAAIAASLGDALIEAGREREAEKLWLAFVEKHSDFTLADKLLHLVSDRAMAMYRKLEKLEDAAMNPAQRWLRAELAHAAKLEGLAFEQMRQLAEKDGCIKAWESLGRWHRQAAELDQAARCFARALELCTAGDDDN